MEEGAGISETGSLSKASWCEWKGTADIAGALVLKASAGAGCCDVVMVDGTVEKCLPWFQSHIFA